MLAARYFGTRYFGSRYFGAKTGGALGPSATPDRYGSADLVAMCMEKAGRPVTDASMDSAAWCRLLTEAQDMFLPEIASRAPHALQSQYATLRTTDGGRTYHFGTDVYGEPLFPMGHVEVWAKEGGRELFAASYAPGGDFTIDGAVVRSPGGTPRTYASGPFARWVGVPPAITLDVEPIIYPRAMRICLVYYAVMLWAERGARRDPSPWAEGFRREWLGNPLIGTLGWCAHLQLRFKTQNAPATGRVSVPWWQLL